MTSETKKPGFGFAARVARIPAETEGPTPTVPLRETDAAAQRRGFVTREPEQLVRLREPSNAPTAQINVRAEVADLNVFMLWCKEQRLSYREAFKRIAVAIEAGKI